jgi:transcription antitermination factor NusG
VLNFEVGDFVKIIDGGFADEEGFGLVEARARNIKLH